MAGPRSREFKAVVEHDLQTGLFVGYVPGFPGAHSQAGTLEELSDNLLEVVKMLLEDGEPELEARFVAIQTVNTQVCLAFPYSNRLR